jgi:cation diffusion facilitator family transporter
MMIIEIAAGWWFRSMAVLADGWHMSTHAAALTLTGLAYVYARRARDDTRFAFGPWKIEALGGYTSAVILGIVVVSMAWESLGRLREPLDIRYDQAMLVAVVGLVVNLVSVWLLGGEEASHSHSHGHTDHNLRAAYLHVIADATTSVLAIAALLAGKLLGWRALDPLMGIVGGVLISVWAYGLIRDTSRVLLDREMDHPVVGEIRECLERDGNTRVSDLHVWRIGRASFACAVSVESSGAITPEAYRERLAEHQEVAHSTIEVVRREE